MATGHNDAMTTMYEAASRNFREVEKSLTQLERAINSAVRNGDDSTVKSLTRVQILLVSVKAEARLIKIAYMPDGLTASERSTVLAEKALDRWKSAVDLAFRRHYKVNQRYRLEDRLDHDPLAKHQTLMSLVDGELNHIISLRNKLAHGQWVFPFNADLTAVEPQSLGALQTENTLSLKYRDTLVTQLGHIVVVLVQSAPSFESRFNEYFIKVRASRKYLEASNYDAWANRLRSRKPILTRASAP
jgi:hypothetical protein